MSVLFIMYCTTIKAIEYELQTAQDGFQWRLFEQYGLLGAQDAMGKVLVPAQYIYVNYENGTFTVQNNSKAKGKYSKTGKMIFPAWKFNQIYEIKGEKNGPFIVVSSDGWGVIARNGKKILDDSYVNIEPIKDSKHGYYYILRKNGFMGVADSDGKIIIKPDTYHEIGKSIGLDDNVTFNFVIYGKGSGVCDKTGKEIIRTTYYTTTFKTKGKDVYYEVTNGNSVGTLNLKGEVITPITNSHDAQITPFAFAGKSLILWRAKNNKMMVTDTNGGVIIEPEYDMIGVYKNYFVVTKGQYQGLLDENGKMIISPDSHYTQIYFMQDYVLGKTLDDNKAIIGYDGELIFPAIHKHVVMNVKQIYTKNDTIISFADMAPGGFGVKDLQGNVLVQPIWDDLNYIESNYGFYFHIFRNRKVGLQDLNGNILLQPEYNNITLCNDKNNPFFWIRTGAYYGVADLQGKIIINPETFEDISFDSKTKQFTGTIGKRKCVFSYDGKLLSDNQPQVQRDEYINQADLAFEEEKYKIAAEYYTKAIAVSPSAVLFFNRGISYYNMDKYTDAISDFRLALKSNPSDRVRDRAIDLIGKAEYYQEQKEIRRLQIVQAIFGVALTGINYAIQSQAGYTSTPTYNSNYSTQSSNSSSYDSYSNSSSNSSTSQQKQKCGFCGGKGSTIDYVANFGINEEPWCDECGKRVTSGHYHKKCTHCNGTGER